MLPWQNSNFALPIFYVCCDKIESNESFIINSIFSWEHMIRLHLLLSFHLCWRTSKDISQLSLYVALVFRIDKFVPPNAHLCSTEQSVVSTLWLITVMHEQIYDTDQVHSNVLSWRQKQSSLCFCVCLWTHLKFNWFYFIQMKWW